MTRAPAARISRWLGVLLIAAPCHAATQAGSTAEPVSSGTGIDPQSTWTGTATFLGAAGGAALGLSIGGLSRPSGASKVVPFLRWGGVGTVFGAVLGHAVGRSGIDETPPEPGLRPAPTRDTTACAGALIGELAGFGIGSLLGRPVARDSRPVWAAIPLGAVVGAAAGWLITPPAFLAAPGRQSRRMAALELEQERLEPLVAVGPAAHDALQRAEADPLRPEPARPASDQPRLDSLRFALLRPESERMLAPRQPGLTIAPVPDVLPALAPPPVLGTLARSVLSLSLLEGAALGGAGGGAVTGSDSGFYERIGLGMVIGALAGWSASASLTGSWTEDSSGARVDFHDAIDQAHHTSGVLVGGLVGTVLGAATGAVLHNVTSGVDRTDMARAAMAGNVAGLFAGFLFSASRAELALGPTEP